MNSTLKECSKLSIVRKNPCLKSERDKNLYEQRHETGDIKFIIDAQEIHAHRCLLAALSPRYKAQFYGAMAEKGVINVSGVSAAAFDEFLQFFYMDAVKLTIENIENVLDLAKQSLVDELVTECIDFLLDAIGLDKLLWGYRLAIRYEIESVKKFCLKHIKANIKAVFTTTDFLGCDHDMLCHILSLKLLKCNEHDLFNGCISWALEKCENDGIDGTNTANLRMALGDALFRIRFRSMAAQEFAIIGKDYAGLLSAQESIEIFQSILLNDEKSNNAKNNGDSKSLTYLKCKFIKGLPIQRDTQTKQDCIGFTCDKTIKLHGFIMCSRIVDNVKIEVYVKGKPTKSDWSIKTSNTKTRFKFDETIRVRRNEECRIFVKCLKTSKKSSIGWYGYNVVSSNKQNGVSFRFQRDNRDGIYSITHLLFNMIDDTAENLE